MTETKSESKYQFVEIASQEDVPEGERLAFDIGSIPVVLFHTTAGFFAIEDLCTHENSPLNDGELSGMSIKCLEHGACFDIRTGAALNLPAVKPTRTFPVRLTDGKIQVGIPV